MMFLLCTLFSELSAQTIRWEVSGYATLQISINGVNQFSSPMTSSNGVIEVPPGAYVEIFGGSTLLNYPLEPICCEDDESQILRGHEIEYNFLNEEQTALYEYLVMPDLPWYINMHS